MAFGYREATEQEQAEANALLVPAGELLPDQRAFINAYLAVGTINGAHKRSKIHKFYHYCWLRDYPEYQAAFAQAEAVVLDDDIAKIRQRGLEGWLEPLNYQGKLTGDKVRRYSDNLAMFYIKAKDQRFKDNHKGDSVTINVKGDSPVQFNFDQFRTLLKS